MSNAARYCYFTQSRSGYWSVAADDVVVMGLPLFSLLLLSFFFSIAPATTLHSCPNIATTVIEEEEESRTLVGQYKK